MTDLILTNLQGVRWSVNNITRQKDHQGNDILSYTCNGRLTTIKTDEVLSITTC